MDDWMTADDAARALRVTTSMVYRYGKGDPPKLRTMQAGRRTLFSRPDVLALADETAAENKPPPATDIVRVDDLLQKVEAAAHRIGYLEAQLDTRLTPEEADALKAQIHRLQYENERLQADIARTQTPAPSRSWWQRLRGS